MTLNVIEIDRVPLEVLATTTEDRAERLTRRIRSAVERSLPTELAAFAATSLAQDDGYIFIDRMEIECGIGGDWNDDAIGRIVGEQLAQRLHHQIHGGNIVRFNDRIEYLAVFIVALTDGGAFSRWWFDEFDGLKLLPLSTALRTIVINEGELGIAALARLTDATARRVLSTLTSADAQRMLSWVVALRAANENNTVSDIELGVLSGVIADERFDARSLEPRDQLGAWIALERQRARSVTAVLTPAAGPDESKQDDATTSGFTPYGGALLLLARLLRLNWWTQWREALFAHDGNGERADELCPALALGIIARALSTELPDTIQDDPLLRRVFGTDTAGPLDQVWQEHIRETLRLLQLTIAASDEEDETQLVGVRDTLEPLLHRNARNLLHQFAAVIPGCAESSHAYLRSQFLALSASVVIGNESIEVRLGRPPLDVLLVLAGIKRTTQNLPDGRRLVLREEPFQ